MKRYEVIHSVFVGIDESKFTEEFMEEFRESLYPFYTLDDHREHLAQLYARGIVDEFTNFIEGYGDPMDFGIVFKNDGVYVEKWDDVL